MILHGFAKLVRNQPRKQLLKTNVLKTNARNTQKKINEKLRSLEVDLQNKADTIETDRLQRERK